MMTFAVLFLLFSEVAAPAVELFDEQLAVAQDGFGGDGEYYEEHDTFSGHVADAVDVAEPDAAA